jgi:hypothetical protein
LSPHQLRAVEAAASAQLRAARPIWHLAWAEGLFELVRFWCIKRGLETWPGSARTDRVAVAFWRNCDTFPRPYWPPRGHGALEFGKREARANSVQQHVDVPLRCAPGLADDDGALGAEIGSRIPVPDERFMQIELLFGDSPVMIADEFPEFGAVSPLTLGGTYGALTITTDEVDELWELADPLAGAPPARLVPYRGPRSCPRCGSTSCVSQNGPPDPAAFPLQTNRFEGAPEGARSPSPRRLRLQPA